jgi:hypothetical protein
MKRESPDEVLADDASDEARELCHEIFAFSMANQAHMAHPSASGIDPEHWQTLCHNFAVLAAVLRDGNELCIDNGDGDVLASTHAGPMQ